MAVDALALIRSVRDPTPVQPLELEGRAPVLLKREDVGPNGAFKWRGALVACAGLQADGVRTVVTASTGNHGAAVAWAAARLGLDAHVVVPIDVVAAKRELIERHGATLHQKAGDTPALTAHARTLAEHLGGHFFEDGADDRQLQGTATIGQELAEQVPGLDAVVVPLACGALLGGLARGLPPATRVVGVQSVHHSRIAAELAGADYAASGGQTIADGLADDRIVEPAFGATRQAAPRIVVLDDDALREAIALLWRRAGIVAEGAGAASLAAVLRDPDCVPADARVAVVVSGGNLPASLRASLLDAAAPTGR